MPFGSVKYTDRMNPWSTTSVTSEPAASNRLRSISSACSSGMGSIVRRAGPGTFGRVPQGLAFDDVMIVMIAAVAVPLLLGLAPSLPIPSSVLEIAAGILLGPAVLNWVTDDTVITVFSQ